MSYRERERIKRKAQRWIANLQAMSAEERTAIVDGMKNAGLLNNVRFDDTDRNNERRPPTVKNDDAPTRIATIDEVKEMLDRYIQRYYFPSTIPGLNTVIVLDLIADTHSPSNKSFKRWMKEQKIEPPPNIDQILRDAHEEERLKAWA